SRGEENQAGRGDIGEFQCWGRARVSVWQRPFSNSGYGHLPAVWKLCRLLSSVRSTLDVAQRGWTRRRARTVMAGATGRLCAEFFAEFCIWLWRLPDRVFARRLERRAH